MDNALFFCLWITFSAPVQAGESFDYIILVSFCKPFVHFLWKSLGKKAVFSTKETSPDKTMPAVDKLLILWISACIIVVDFVI